MWFKNLKVYDKELRKYGAKLIIHGSFADSKITNYSDVDLVIFYQPFSENVLKIKIEIEVFLLQVDPLQHHGIFMIDANTFDFYWQMDLPIEVLNKAKCFSDDGDTLNIQGILKENSGALHALKSIFIGIEQFLDKDYKQIGLWEWKFFISQLLLLPTLLLGSKGNYIYKRDSFEIVKKLFSHKAWYCIDKASEIRDEWPDRNTLREYESLRNSVLQKPSKDSIKAIDILSISTANDLQFSDSLKALTKESEFIISHD
ncbi:MAG: nucleotidyltransferase domain-containing protein [Ginsengibacter sp.]